MTKENSLRSKFRKNLKKLPESARKDVKRLLNKTPETSNYKGLILVEHTDKPHFTVLRVLPLGVATPTNKLMPPLLLG